MEANRAPEGPAAGSLRSVQRGSPGAQQPDNTKHPAKKVTRASLMDDITTAGLPATSILAHQAGAEQPDQLAAGATRPRRTKPMASPSSPLSSRQRLAQFQKVAEKSTGSPVAGKEQSARGTSSSSSASSRLGLYQPRPDLSSDRLVAMQRKHLMSKDSGSGTAAGGREEGESGTPPAGFFDTSAADRLDAAREAALFQTGPQLMVPDGGAYLPVDMQSVAGTSVASFDTPQARQAMVGMSASSTQAAARDVHLPTREGPKPSDVPLRPSQKDIAEMRAREQADRAARPLSRHDVHHHRQDGEGSHEGLQGTATGEQEVHSKDSSRTAAPAKLASSRTDGATGRARPPEAWRRLAPRQQQPRPRGARETAPITQHESSEASSPVQRNPGTDVDERDESERAAASEEGPVTSPAMRKVLAEAGAEQPIPRFKRREAELLDAVLHEAMELYGADALRSSLRRSSSSGYGASPAALQDGAVDHDDAPALDLDALAASTGVSAHRLRLRALTRELADIEGQLDEERDRLETDSGDFDGLAAALRDQLQLLDSLRKDSSILEKIPPEAMVTVAKAAEEAVVAVASAAESMGFTTADIRASVRSAEGAIEAARVRKDVLLQVTLGASRGIAAGQQPQGGFAGASLPERSAAATSGSALVSSPSPEIRPAMTSDCVTEHAGDGAWRVTTKVTRRLQRVRVGGAPAEHGSRSSSGAPAGRLRPSPQHQPSAVSGQSKSTRHGTATRSDNEARHKEETAAAGRALDSELWVLRA